MSNEQEPTQRTEQGHEIPVPKRSAWDRLLHKVSHPKPPNGGEVSPEDAEKIVRRALADKELTDE